MKSVVIGGGTGTVGSRLKILLEGSGYHVHVLTRDRTKAESTEGFLFWDIENQIIDEGFNNADIIINLAGSGIADGRWSKRRKSEIINSRVATTRLLINEAQQRNLKIKAYISASAIGYYGDGGHTVLHEESPVQTEEFLSEVCVSWEKEASKASAITDHVTILRIGTVLSPSGGALEKIDATIPYGIANYLGHGRQWMSWIHIDDLCRMIIHAIEQQLDGIYNAIAPEVVSNKTFTRVLRDTINPKALLLPAPALGIKMMLGEMARVVLNSSHVSARKISDTGFQFDYPNLDQALLELYQK